MLKNQYLHLCNDFPINAWAVIGDKYGDEGNS